MALTFKRSERLKSEKIIGRLFASGGQAYLAYPVRVVWIPLTVPSESPVQVLVSAPKKQFKTATARNRIKRLVREAWRLHKHELYAQLAPGQPPIALLLMYIAKEELSFKEVENGVKKAISKLLPLLQPA
jgi:ribonuclease P protein component